MVAYPEEGAPSDAVLVVGIINPALLVDKGKEEETALVSIAFARFWSSHDDII